MNDGHDGVDATLRLAFPTQKGKVSELGVCVGIETDDGLGTWGYDYGTAYEAGFVEHGFDEFVIGNRVAAVAVWFGAGAAP